MRRWGALVLSSVLAVLGCASPTPSPAQPGPSATAAPAATLPGPTLATSTASAAALVPSALPGGSPLAQGLDGMPAFVHIYVIILENRDYSAIVGNPQAPYLNSLIAADGLATNYHSVGSPSQPNYLALVSGSTHDIGDDQVHNIDAPNLADQLDAAGKTWAAYEQSLPGPCFTGVSSTGPDGGLYVRKHNPFISFVDIAGDPARCSRISDLTSFDPAAADFELIVPDESNDMHNGSTAQGDAFLGGFVPQILQSAAWQQGGALFILWDEGTSGNHVPLIVASPLTAAGARSDVGHSHYSLLRSVEDSFGLPCLATACQANNLAEFFSGG